MTDNPLKCFMHSAHNKLHVPHLHKQTQQSLVLAPVYIIECIFLKEKESKASTCHIWELKAYYPTCIFNSLTIIENYLDLHLHYLYLEVGVDDVPVDYFAQN